MRILVIIFGILFVVSVAHAAEYKVDGKITGSESTVMKSKKYVVIGAVQGIPTFSSKESKVPVIYPQEHKVRVLSDQKKKIN